MSSIASPATMPTPEMSADDANDLDRPKTVELAELNALAALQTRVDRKYLVPIDHLAGLLCDVQDTARVLEIDDKSTFAYRSTYFDTPTFTSYLAAVRSRPHRFKVRVRTYLDDDLHYLEVKTRSRKGQTIKTRCPASAGDHEQLSSAAMAFVLDSLSTELPERQREEHPATVSALKPTLTTQYDRTTLLVEPAANEYGPANAPSRATIDVALCFSAPGADPVTYPDVAIVETKTTGRPSPIDRLLWRARFRPTKISKFGVGFAVLHPEVSANKWNRVLASDLGWERH